MIFDRPLPLATLRSHRDDLLAALVTALDDTDWRPVGGDADIRVEAGHPPLGPGRATVPEEGFHLVSELQGPTVDHALAYFHDACHFADTANRMTSASQIISVLDDRVDHYEAVVRTGFRLPWPLQDREFLHYVTSARTIDAEGRRVGLIAYATVTEDDQPPAWDGAMRCAMRASGQRATDLGNGRLRLEHGMTYPLGGAISPWVQNRLFHRSHVGAYLHEWQTAMGVLQAEGAEPARAAGRPAGPATLR